MFNYALPLLFPSNHRGFIIPPAVTTETILLLRDQAARPYADTRGVLEGLVVICAVALLFEAVGLVLLRRQYQAWLDGGLPKTQKGTGRRLSLWEFLSGNLESLSSAEVARAIERHRMALGEQRQEEERFDLTLEAQRLRDALDLSETQRAQLERAAAEGSLEELRRLVEYHRSMINERNAQREREEQHEKDRQREIHRLVRGRTGDDSGRNARHRCA